MASEGKLDPVIGREKEIERIIQILSRRTKNNPVLIGEAGVGKTAVAEGLAQKIQEGNIPELLKDKRIVTLDLAGMVAGAKYRGEFEERLKNIMQEIKKDGNVILFIDEMHTIIGAGAAEGAIDASNILKPALAGEKSRQLEPPPWMSTESMWKRILHWSEDFSRLWWGACQGRNRADSLRPAG
jgi:ATP-dependent Clp protease ATP-binding subunit ClpC